MSPADLPRRQHLRADGVSRGLWFWTLFLIAVLLMFRGRLDVWEKPIQAALGASLLAMGFWQFRRLTAHGWWKGHWRYTLRSQRHEEWMAVCLAVVSANGFGFR
jgi:hypothetical protein